MGLKDATEEGRLLLLRDPAEALGVDAGGLAEQVAIPSGLKFQLLGLVDGLAEALAGGLVLGGLGVVDETVLPDDVQRPLEQDAVVFGGQGDLDGDRLDAVVVHGADDAVGVGPSVLVDGGGQDVLAGATLAELGPPFDCLQGVLGGLLGVDLAGVGLVGGVGRDDDEAVVEGVRLQDEDMGHGAGDHVGGRVLAVVAFPAEAGGAVEEGAGLGLIEAGHRVIGGAGDAGGEVGREFHSE